MIKKRNIAVERASIAIFLLLSFTIVVLILRETISMVKFEKPGDGTGEFSGSPKIGVLSRRNFNEYKMSQRTGFEKRMGQLGRDFFEHVVFTLFGATFLLDWGRRRIARLCGCCITFVRWDILNVKRKDINLLSLSLGLYLFLKVVFSNQMHDVKSTINSISVSMTAYFFVIPFASAFLLFMFNKFGAKLILACYIAYVLKIMLDLTSNNDIDFTRMRKCDISVFPENVQNLLKKSGMEDKVYITKAPTENINAAIIGYGDNMRIEIYGDVTRFSPGKIMSIFLHELGHAHDSSMIKKTATYFVLVAVECAILISIYALVAPSLCGGAFLAAALFIPLLLTYKTSVRQWLFMLYNVISRRSEVNSDMFAKKYGYGKELATTLYDISVESREYIGTTGLYDTFISGHPSVLQRIEELLS